MKTLLRDICYIRSGDKGDVCTAGLIAMTPEAYPTLLASVTPEKVKALYGDWIKGDVELYPMDNIQALVVVMRRALGGDHVAISDTTLDPVDRKHAASRRSGRLSTCACTAMS